MHVAAEASRGVMRPPNQHQNQHHQQPTGAQEHERLFARELQRRATTGKARLPLAAAVALARAAAERGGEATGKREPHAVVSSNGGSYSTAQHADGGGSTGKPSPDLPTRLDRSSGDRTSTDSMAAAAAASASLPGGASHALPSHERTASAHGLPPHALPPHVLPPHGQPSHGLPPSSGLAEVSTEELKAEIGANLLAGREALLKVLVRLFRQPNKVSVARAAVARGAVAHGGSGNGGSGKSGSGKGGGGKGAVSRGAVRKSRLCMLVVVSACA
jgi:hypothetical protein